MGCISLKLQSRAMQSRAQSPLFPASLPSVVPTCWLCGVRARPWTKPLAQPLDKTRLKRNGPGFLLSCTTIFEIVPGQLQEAVSCPNEGHLRGYEVFLTHGIADFQRDTMSGIVSACPANGAFLNQTQLFVLTTQASQGIEFHGSIRKAVICPTKIAGAKLCLQLPVAIKTSILWRPVVTEVLPHSRCGSPSCPSWALGAFLQHVVCLLGGRRKTIFPILYGMTVFVDSDVTKTIATSWIISLTVTCYAAVLYEIPVNYLSKQVCFLSYYGCWSCVLLEAAVLQTALPAVILARVVSSKLLMWGKTCSPRPDSNPFEIRREVLTVFNGFVLHPQIVTFSGQEFCFKRFLKTFERSVNW